MSQHNPYQSPQTPIAPYAPQPAMNPTGGPMGLWRSGNQLVMHKSAQLPPNVCIKSNQPATQQLRRNLSWYPPWVIATFLAGLIVFVIIALVLTKKATIYIGLSDEWAARRRKRIAICWLLALVMIVVGFAGFWMFIDGSKEVRGADMDRSGLGCIVCLIAFVALIGAAIGGNSARLVTPAKIDDQYVWLKGVHPDFLAKLPEWQYPY